MCVCMYVCMYDVCMYVCIYVFMYVCMHLCVCVCARACLRACVCAYKSEAARVLLQPTSFAAAYILLPTYVYPSLPSSLSLSPCLPRPCFKKRLPKRHIQPETKP